MRKGLKKECTQIFILLAVCAPEDLLIPGVVWILTPVFNNGMGIYSFSGGNVTFDGVSLGSTATYTTNEHYRINGSQTFTSRCGGNTMALPSQGIVAGNYLGCSYIRIRTREARGKGDHFIPNINQTDEHQHGQRTNMPLSLITHAL